MNDFVIKLGQAAAHSYLEKVALSPEFIGRSLVGAGGDRIRAGLKKGIVPNLKGKTKAQSLKRLTVEQSSAPHWMSAALASPKVTPVSGLKNKTTQRSTVTKLKASAKIPSLKDLR